MMIVSFILDWCKVCFRGKSFVDVCCVIRANVGQVDLHGARVVNQIHTLWVITGLFWDRDIHFSPDGHAGQHCLLYLSF